MQVKQMNKYQKRFLETTLPMIICYGTIVLVLTNLFGFKWGVVGIGVFTVWDIFTVGGTMMVDKGQT